MTASHLEKIQLRHKTGCPDAGFPFHQLPDPWIEHRGHSVKDHSLYLASHGSFKLQKALYDCSQRYAGSSGINHQHCRKIQYVSHLPGAGSCGASSKAVKISHDPFHHRQMAFGQTAVFIPKFLRRLKVAVQVHSFQLQHLFVKQSVNIIRSAFAGQGI